MLSMKLITREFMTLMFLCWQHCSILRLTSKCLLYQPTYQVWPVTHFPLPIHFISETTKSWGSTRYQVTKLLDLRTSVNQWGITHFATLKWSPSSCKISPTNPSTRRLLCCYVLAGQKRNFFLKTSASAWMLTNKPCFLLSLLLSICIGRRPTSYTTEKTCLRVYTVY